MAKKLTRTSRTLFVALYPHFHLVYHLVPLTYHIAYLFEATDFHIPTNRLAGLTTRRMGPDDYVRLPWEPFSTAFRKLTRHGRTWRGALLLKLLRA